METELSMISATTSENQRAFAHLLLKVIMRPGEVWSFRKVAKLGIPQAKESLTNEYMRFVPKTLPQFLKPGAKSLDDSDFARLSRDAATTSLSQYQKGIDGASLLFMHTILDTTVFDCLSLCKEIYPEGWRSRLEKRKDVFEKSIIKDLRNLERESVMVKIDFLMSICEPKPEYNPVDNYKYDRERLSAINDVRNKVAHGAPLLGVTSNIEDDLWYLSKTGIFVVSILGKVFELTIDEEIFEEIVIGTKIGGEN